MRAGLPGPRRPIGFSPNFIVKGGDLQRFSAEVSQQYGRASDHELHGTVRAWRGQRSAAAGEDLR
jgi:hypothetical protein